MKTRKEAIRDGDKYYFTGKECLEGHKAKRNTITAACTECVGKYIKKTRQQIRLQNSSFERKEFLIHPLDVNLVKNFIEFVNISRLNPERNNDIKLVMDYIKSIDLARNFK